MRVWTLVLLAACTAEDLPAGTADPDCDGEGEDLTLLARKISFVHQEEAGVSDGFDLDGRVSDTRDAAACGVEDLVAPDGTPGVDNAFSGLLPVLALTEAGVLEDLIQDSINGGALLLMVGLGEVDDPADDACVDVAMLKGAGTPMIGADGLLLANQTLRVDPSSVGVPDAGNTIEEGTLWAGPIAEVDLPITVLNFETVITLHDVRVRLRHEEDGVWRGFVGGGVDLQELIDIATYQGIAPEVFALIEPVLGRLADLAPDEGGDCTQISATLEIEAVPAFVWGE